MDILRLLKNILKEGGSDLFVAAGKPVFWRSAGNIKLFDKDKVSAEDINAFRIKNILPEAEKKYNEKGSFDAGITLDDGVRFRINFFVQQGKPAFTARPVPFADTMGFKDLNLSGDIEKIASLSGGLVLIAGTAGSGKSTTMAAIVNCINHKYSKHVVTIEDPIEFIYSDKKSLVTQREVGADTLSFAEALRNVVRESPDVIVIGEMRDSETLQTAISAALTGHLVITTVHTADTIQCVERIIDGFPEHQRQHVAENLAMALQFVVAQRLVRPEGAKTLIPVNEILKATPLVRNLIVSRNFEGLENAIKQGREEGMITFDRALSELYKAGRISIENGLLAASSKEEFALLADGMESGIETFRGIFSESDGDDGEVNMKRLLHSALSNGASDLIITASAPPILRVDGDLNELDLPPLTPADTKRLLFSIINRRQRAVFEEKRELDFALSINLKKKEGDNLTDVPHRFRVNGFFQRGNIASALRVINQSIPEPAVLGIPSSIISLAEKKHGLILVTGPTGHGKSTTLASLIDRINQTRPCHIITVEDPIEYVHENKMAIIEQREVNSDTLSFASALKYVLRQDPDVILVGEMRDTETIAAALTAAETGHLVLATLHTNDAPQTIDRIVDSFPNHQQNQIRLQLAACLLGIVSQRLIPKKGGEGRVAAFEVIVGTPAIRSLVRNGKTEQIQGIIETSTKEGMITMEKALGQLFDKGLISKEDIKNYLGARGIDSIR